MAGTNLLTHKIGFTMAKGITGDTGRELLRRIGSASAFFELSAAELRALTGINAPIFAENYRKELLVRAEKEANFICSNSIRTIFREDEDYPTRLQECQDAPLMLYAVGKCDLNLAHFVSIVGTRHATPYGIDFTTRLVADLAKQIPDLVIVSGLAFGIDVAAHKAALKAGIPTVAVMAHGLNTIYPAEHRSVAAQIVESGGAILTEYPSDYQMNRGSFLARNRIVAGISDCLVVAESDLKGGSMSTARIAGLYGKDVFALPGRVNDMYSRGTNHLIANNAAALITCAKDLAEEMNWNVFPPLVVEKEEKFSPLPAELQSILDFIKKNPDATVNDMCVALAVPFATISDRIFQLEMMDRIILLPGGKFSVSTNI